MPTIERTITTTTEPQKVWDYLSDFRTTEQWDPPSKQTDRLQGDGSVGTTYRNVSSVLGRDVEIEYVVTEHDAPHRLVLEGKTKSMRLRDTIMVSPFGSGAQVIYRAQFTPLGASKLLTPVLPIFLKQIGDKSAAQLSKCLQAL